MRIILLCLILLVPILQTSSQANNQEFSGCEEVRAKLAWLESYLIDFPLLGRYREANKNTAPPVKDENRVVFFGDSITDAWDDPQFGGFFPGKPYINRGINGQTTQQMLIRFRPDVIALKPRVAVILAGTNDIAWQTTLQAIEDNLTSMAELACANGIRVVLASLLPVSDYEKDMTGRPITQTLRRPPEQIRNLNGWIKRYAADNGYTYLDYYSAMADEKGFLKAELSDDGLHPNAKGYALMSPLAEQGIATALKKGK